MSGGHTGSRIKVCLAVLVVAAILLLVQGVPSGMRVHHSPAVAVLIRSAIFTLGFQSISVLIHNCPFDWFLSPVVLCFLPCLHAQGIISNLRQFEDEGAQLSALTELSELLSISQEESLAATMPVETVVPLLVRRLAHAT